MNQSDDVRIVQYGSMVVDMPHLTEAEAVECAKYISERVTRFNEELLKRAMRASRGEKSWP